ncbi:3D-(3,5/4)-trihydroxycyclohexane-1,2-dione acylhydrolase (decyclizing) [Pontimonas sp.]|nr:3D-(3,5/4)-trihydroxycyclohexane-1,2-dione acylhydrolase (decyclizing) [Pontimonas sp.]MDA8862789.1 3D-(3,5/4)-trihydroxycyclohexane-1,2-dione acylhydrolase (decyclizing) [Pontimonas sp.]
MTRGQSGQTVRLTVAQALVKFIAAQYSVADGHRQRFIPAALGIFGHGNVAGLGQALDQFSDDLPFVQGRNEQGLAHSAVAFAKAQKRRQTLAVTASVGPGAMNMVTPAALATVNRLPVLLLPGDVYATRRQGPVLQQLEYPGGPDVSVNDAFRPISRFFDRITRPEQLLVSLPQAFRALANPAETGAVVISLPQDVQSHAFDYPVEFFAERDWIIRRPTPEASDITAVAAMIKAAKKPVIVAGGGIHYSDATPELEALASATGIPVAETFGGKGAIQNPGPWHLRGIGLEGTPQTRIVVSEADLIVHVGTRMGDFATGSQSMFDNPDVKFASINVCEHDGIKQAATTVVADAKKALAALLPELGSYTVPSDWAASVKERMEEWWSTRAEYLDSSVVFDQSTLPDSEPTDAILTQAQLIGLMQETSREGDTIITAAGGPPGDLQKAWDATEGRHCHLEFGFSCMGYEIPAAMGVRWATPDPSKRVLSFVGDGTFVMAPTELVTACQENLRLTVVISENHGYQVIRRLQMWRTGAHFGNEFRYRQGDQMITEDGAGRLEGGYLDIDLVKMAEGMGAKAVRPYTADEVRAALEEARDHDGPFVIVVPTVPHANLPSANVWWDVAPAEVHEQPWIEEKRAEYEAGLAHQKWHG